MKRTVPYIVLADDDADDRLLMDLCFAELAWSEHVKIVGSGEDLILYLNDLAGPVYPNLIVLDYNMLQQNGEQVLRHLKKHEAYKRIPVVIYSTSMPVDLSHQLQTLGAVSCHTKPDRFDRILELAKTFRNLAENRP